MRLKSRVWLRRAIAASFVSLGMVAGALMVSGALAQETQPETQPPVLPPTEVEATPEAEPMVDFNDEAVFDPFLNGYTFRSPAVQGYRAGSSTAGTLIDIPDIDLPATVNSIPRDLLNDQQALEFNDVVRNSGATISGGDGLFADKVFLRGLEINSRDFRKNGFQDSTYTPRDFQNVERIEILKGPASVLYGANNPGGMINLVTKKPIASQFSDVRFTFGSFNQERYTLDHNGYGTSDGSVLYRVNAAYEDQNTFRNYGKLERTLISPVVTWFLSDTTYVTWEGEFHRDDRRGDRGVPAINGNALAVPARNFIGDPARDFIHYEDYRQQLSLVSELNDNWTFSIGAQSLFYEFPGVQTPAVAQVGGANSPFFARTESDFRDQEQNQSLIANLAGDVDIFDINHKLLFGTEQVYYDSISRFTTNALAGGGVIDVLNPVYTNPAGAPVFVFDAPVFRQQRNGFYIQDLVQINDYWQVLGGVRFDRLELKYERNLGFGMITNDETYNQATPRGGVVFKPLLEQNLACYFNYSRSFSPPGGGAFNLTGAPMLPELGELFELGIKTELVENLTLNVAGYYTTRENASFTTGFVTQQFGRERSQGAEINLLGNVTERWDVVANYAYTDTELTDPTNVSFFGQRQRNVPLNQANLWSRYDLIEDEVQTFGAAIGIVYAGDRAANLANSVILPAYSRWDAGVYYNRGRLTSSLYLENIFDVAYATSSIDQFQIFPGAPVNARAQVGIVY